MSAMVQYKNISKVYFTFSDMNFDDLSVLFQLANVLQVDLEQVKDAVSLYCRLGFAKKKGLETNAQGVHPSWENANQNVPSKKYV